MKKLNVSLVRARNIVEIVNAISEQEGISRAEIAERASVSVMTVSNIMEVLLRNGAVYETEQRTENVGRNPALVYFSRTKWMIILDLSGWRFSCNFVNLGLQTFAELSRAYDKNATYLQNLENFLLWIQSRTTDLELSMEECIGISVSLPSVYNMESDRTETLRIPPLSDVPIKGTIRKFFDCTVIASADAKLAGIACSAELRQYAAESILYLCVDDSVHGALLSEGNVVMGTDGYAGDFGQMLLSSGSRLEPRLSQLYETMQGTLAARGEPLSAVWDTPDAQDALEEYLDALATSLYNAICVLSPRVVVLDGYCMQFGERLNTSLTERIHPMLFPETRQKPDILFLSSPPNKAITGAAIRLRDKWIKELA